MLIATEIVIAFQARGGRSKKTSVQQTALYEKKDLQIGWSKE